MNIGNRYNCIPNKCDWEKIYGNITRDIHIKIGDVFLAYTIYYCNNIDPGEYCRIVSLDIKDFKIYCRISKIKKLTKCV
jgi:hypothetical protein